MSTRGTNFIHQWIGDNLDEIGDADETTIAEMVMKLFADAQVIGISEVELEEDMRPRGNPRSSNGATE
ncbi:DUF768 domain-containing protein [Mesorhizobium sp. WSM4303]|uniref:DUF768 domain-containing protein n=1 Tax=unclassified Mesorhizobium TaxID=325217 RepID=UPI00115DC353|nr:MULTISPECIES: DUF768 domain-containing protein [unclassified Mesorhizobium]TRC98263.1 DUF768 domain-containing protein [Mesorhizobium sp. WSM4306]TRD04240.1 DUF768 domain-containing protein [Mesorhizobium sp. WSM4303]